MLTNDNERKKKRMQWYSVIPLALEDIQNSITFWDDMRLEMDYYICPFRVDSRKQ